mgnify:CR=1 FL=1
MKTLGEVFDSQFGIKLPQQISQGELTQLNINKQARLITLTVKFNGLVECNTLFRHGKADYQDTCVSYCNKTAFSDRVVFR